MIGLLEERIIKYSDIDLIIIKVSKGNKKLNDKQFNNFIVKLCQHMDPTSFKENPRLTCINIINTLFDPFLEFVQKRFNLNDHTYMQWNTFVCQELEKIIEQYECNFQIIAIIKEVFPGLKTLYQSYFESELTGQVSKEKSFQQYHLFCKDFELFPFILSLNQIALYWKLINEKQLKNVIDKPVIGKFFNSNKFILMNLHFSILTFDKLNSNFYTKISSHGNIYYKSEKLLFFFEKMENSKGFTNFELRTKKRLRINLIPKKETVNIVSIISLS
jgi:hypothetical protein